MAEDWWRIACYTLWTQGVFRPDFKSLLSSGGSRGSEQSPRVTTWEGPKASASQGHCLIIFTPALPLPSCSITCWFWLLCFLVFLISCFSFFFFAGRGFEQLQMPGSGSPCWHWDIYVVCCLILKVPQVATFTFYFVVSFWDNCRFT